MGRQLNPEEKALWGRVMATVKPLNRNSPLPLRGEAGGGVSPPLRKADRPHPNPVEPLGSVRGTDTSTPKGEGPKKVKAAPIPQSNTLDSSWDRRIHKGVIVPDVSVDLHETTLSGAYARLDRALDQAIHQKLRVILLVTGKARSHDRASGKGRGAIAAVVRDWLAASRHSSHISAVRQAHPRHGGDGALYIILKR
jgi:DNA-nicking Smr family endonuclease